MPDDGHNILSAFAELKLAIGDVSSRIKNQTEMQRLASKATQPAFARIPLSGIVPASGFLVLPVQNQVGPEQGRFWYVRSIVVGGTAPGAAVTGRADVFVSAASFQNYTALAQIGMADWRDQTATIPSVAFYGRGEITMRVSENLYIVVSGATNGQQIQAALTIEEYEEAAFKQEYGL